MKKKLYEKPSMRIFPLRQKPALLAGSATAEFDNYQDGNFDWVDGKN
jgi:hypothetical protein